MNKNLETSASSHWILLRGLARETRHWGSFGQELEKAIPGARVDGMDLPGTGRYSEMKSPTSIPAITEFVREKFVELRTRMRDAGQEPPSECHLVAISLGGMVASEWLSRWPEDFVSCTLVNTSFRGYSPILKRLLPESYLHLFNIARHTDWRERERHVLKMVSNRPDMYETIAEEWAKYAYERPVSVENFVRQLAAAGRYQPDLDVPPCRVLVLNSERDRMVSPSCSELIARRWNAELRRHPTAGHDLPLDDPKWTVEQIRAFWAELHGAGSAVDSRHSS